jgi:hypothetical protein
VSADDVTLPQGPGEDDLAPGVHDAGERVVGGRRQGSGHALVGGAAHEVRVRALVNVEFLLPLRRVDGRPKQNCQYSVPSSARRPSREYRNTHAISFRMIRTPWSRVVWGPCLLGNVPVRAGWCSRSLASAVGGTR